MSISQELKNSDQVKCNPYVLNKGGPPPQAFLREDLDEQDLFLFAAWAHGLTDSEPVSKYSLFIYIQSHLACRSFETLEKFLVASYYWIELKNGKYELSEDGMKQMHRFGEIPEKIEFGSSYIFSKLYNGKTYSVMIDDKGQKKMYIDNSHVTAAEIYRKLKKEEVKFDFEANWTPDKVYNWILFEQDYSWVRV